MTVVALGTFALASSSRAGSHTWSGANSIYFNNVSNWSYGGAPAPGETNVYIYFPPDATRFTCSNNIPGLVVNTLDFSGDNYHLQGLPITVRTNISSSGVLNSVSTPILLGSTNLIFNVQSANSLYVGGQISGNGHVTKIGLGALIFTTAGTNSYSGTTYVNAGTLQINNTLGSKLPGPVVVGTPVGSPGTAILKLGTANQIPDTTTVMIYNTGVFDLNNQSEWIGGLTMAGGRVETGTNRLNLFGDIMVQAGTAVINGNLGLYNTNRTFNAVPGGTLNINASLGSFLNNPGFIKTGAGAVNLYGANTFTGPVIVREGYLSLVNPLALANSSGLTVTNNGIVQVFSVGITNIPLRLSGNGNGNGALRAFGTNVWTGPVTYAGNCGIQPYAINDCLFFTGGISGPGALTKLGLGKLVYAGGSATEHTGSTTVRQGTLELDRTGATAIKGTLIIGDATNTPNSQFVRSMKTGQIHHQTDVILNASGTFDLAGGSGTEIFGSLAGAGRVNVGWRTLMVGSNGLTTTFSGQLFGSVPGTFHKVGSGELFLEGDCSAFTGSTTVQSGRFSVNGSLPNSFMHIYHGATLAGDGQAGTIYTPSGKVAPGNSTGLLSAVSLGMLGGATFEVELNGTTAGVDYDQVSVSGQVNITNAALTVVLGFPGAVSNQFMIIQNDANDPVNGTFNGLPEGATFKASSATFQITYAGGTGNDVVLTQLALPQPSEISVLDRNQDGSMRILGTGQPGAVYLLEANSDLNTTNWVNIGGAPADQNGKIQILDNDAPKYPIRFYRLKVQ